MTADIFYDYIQQVLYKSLDKQKVASSVVLFGDGLLTWRSKSVFYIENDK